MYTPKDVFNADETALHYMIFNKIPLVSKGENSLKVKKVKQIHAISVIANMIGHKNFLCSLLYSI